MGDVGNKVMLRGRLKQVGNTIQVMPAAYIPQQNNAGPWCPCWRRHSDRAPAPIVNILFPSKSNQEMIHPMQTGQVTKKV